ncbi:polysaccharide pyruvyl transferase family protein [Pseudoxanthomonas sp. SL93]|uniref:polysaccharide pyruvyl transferase family protein n=1 Tax=Pseudoxanthomonas sp. SL93 TaxID=2995142 RepID=UPI00226F4CDC|nr:polysaccharide pyruvyl transferase family protein [Pseudoxanthomonas sp. SL93]WAC61624.1 polysaccharide pyruvyl transferase family protein [Pseudoxanthomonas sp. SL93]
MSDLNDSTFIYGIEPSLQDAGLKDASSLYDSTGQNTGNLAFHYAIARQLGLNKSVSWNCSNQEIEAAGRLAVMPCANQVGEHLDMGGSAQKLSALNVSIVAIGLGVQSGVDFSIPNVPQGTRAWLKEIGKRSPSSGQPNIAVRGEFSKKVIDGLDIGVNCVALGCPTLFISPDTRLGQTLSAAFQTPSRVCVVAGHYRWRHLARLEASLAHIATVTGGGYVMQSPKEMVQLARGELHEMQPEAIQQCRDFVCPHLSEEEFRKWSHRHSEVFFDTASWMSYYRKFDFVIGARIHGVMLALQAGVPAVCIAHDSRTRELCETMKVPHVLASQVSGGVSRSQLAELWRLDADEFDENRIKLAARYREFLSGNGLASRHMAALVGASI